MNRPWGEMANESPKRKRSRTGQPICARDCNTASESIGGAFERPLALPCVTRRAATRPRPPGRRARRSPRRSDSARRGRRARPRPRRRGRASPARAVRPAPHLAPGHSRERREHRGVAARPRRALRWRDHRPRAVGVGLVRPRAIDEPLGALPQQPRDAGRGERSRRGPRPSERCERAGRGARGVEGTELGHAGEDAVGRVTVSSVDRREQAGVGRRPRSVASATEPTAAAAAASQAPRTIEPNITRAPAPRSHASGRARRGGACIARRPSRSAPRLRTHPNGPRNR